MTWWFIRSFLRQFVRFWWIICFILTNKRRNHTMTSLIDYSIINLTFNDGVEWDGLRFGSEVEYDCLGFISCSGIFLLFTTEQVLVESLHDAAEVWCRFEITDSTLRGILLRTTKKNIYIYIKLCNFIYYFIDIYE